MHVDDCRTAIAEAARTGIKYDAIVVDLMFPQNLEAAKIHHVDSYARIFSILEPSGVLAVNAVSPSRTPDAYWSIYNSMRQCGAHPRPLRICLPSFSGRGYGKDWGFFFASMEPILRSEILSLELAEPRYQLSTLAQLEKLFRFPQATGERRIYSMPAKGESDMLLHYCRNAKSEEMVHEVGWDGLAGKIDEAPIPPVDSGDHLLPFEVRAAFQSGSIEADEVNEQTIFRRIIELMPSMNSGHTRKMIAEFLSDPARFLSTIDFRALVEELLRRASELPKMLVDELSLLKEHVHEFLGDYDRLFKLGTRVVTITALVVIVGNLISPDSVYGKGGESFGSFSADPMGFSRPSHTRFDSFYSEPSIASGRGFRMRTWGNRYVDEEGTIYPARYYSYCGCRYGHTTSTHHIVKAKATFKLSPEADVLPDGKVAIWLNDAAFLILNRDYTSLIDAASTNDVLELAPDQAQLWRVQKEIERQLNGLKLSYKYKREWISWFSWLEFMPWFADDQLELQNLHDMQPILDQALKNIGAYGTVSSVAPPPAEPPVTGAIELLSNIWIMPDANTLAIRLPSGMAWMDDQDWYRDASKKLKIKDLPYPADFKFALRSILSKQIADATANEKKLRANLNDAEATMAALQRDLRDYNACKADTKMWESVDYGSQQISLRDALDRTNADLNRCQQRIDLINKAIYDAPMENEQVQRLLKAWHFPSAPSKPPANATYSDMQTFSSEENEPGAASKTNSSNSSNSTTSTSTTSNSSNTAKGTPQ